MPRSLSPSSGLGRDAAQSLKQESSPQELKKPISVSARSSIRRPQLIFLAQCLAGVPSGWSLVGPCIVIIAQSLILFPPLVRFPIGQPLWVGLPLLLVNGSLVRL